MCTASHGRAPRSVFGPASRDEPPLAEVVRRLADAAAIDLVTLSDVSSACCGLIYDSRGFRDTAARLCADLASRIAQHAYAGGVHRGRAAGVRSLASGVCGARRNACSAVGVLLDASPCTQALLSETSGKSRMPVLDLADFLADWVLPRVGGVQQLTYVAPRVCIMCAPSLPALTRASRAATRSSCCTCRAAASAWARRPSCEASPAVRARAHVCLRVRGSLQRAQRAALSCTSWLRRAVAWLATAACATRRCRAARSRGRSPRFRRASWMARTRAPPAPPCEAHRPRAPARSG